MFDDDQPITVINRAKAQYTQADYELAQEEFRRKTQAREQSRRLRTVGQSAAAPDAASSASQIKQLLLQPDISDEDRTTLERRLHEATMGAAFSQ